MFARALLNPILDDEALTRGLGDPEARMLVEWLVERAERVALLEGGENGADSEIRRLCRRGRALGRFVRLWCYDGERGAAGQLAVAERLHWTLPDCDLEPCELMSYILDMETASLEPTE